MSGVDKRIIPRLRKPKAVADGPRAVYGVTRMGTPGVGIFHHGKMTGWGGNETAAWENHKMGQSMRSTLGKSEGWEVPMDHFEPPTPRKRPNYRDGSGNVVGKRMTGAVTGVAKPKKVQPTRVAARSASAAMPKSGAMPFVNGRQLTPDDVGKGALKDTGHAVRLGFRSGRQGPGFYEDMFEDVPGPHPRRVRVNTVLQRKAVRAGLASRKIKKRDRRYNPEANRQRRLGVATAATGIGGAAAIGSGVRSVREDSQALRGIDPGVVHVPAEPSKPRTQRRGAGGKMERLNAEEHAAEQKDYNERVGHRARRMETRSGLERARAAGERGAVVSRHSGGRLALGAGLLAASGGLARYGRSRSNREWR